MNKSSFVKLDIIILSVILIVAFIFRLYKINTPLADLHSWRQVDTAAVGRNFNKYGFDLLHPRFDDLTSRESGIENPNGYRMVEFPLYSAIFGALFKYIPLTSLEIYARLTSVFFSLGIIASLYYLALKESNRLTAIAAASVYAIFPFFVFFSRMVVPETTAVGLVMASLFFLYQFTENKKGPVFLFSSAILFAAAILTKPTTIFYGGAVAYLIIRHYKWSLLKHWQIYVYAAVAIIPFVLWRLHIRAYPEGIPASAWLLTQVNTFEGVKTIFFRPAFFRWIFWERLGIAIFGIYLSFFFLLGIIVRTKKYFLHSILISVFIYLFTFQGGNVQHEYYQTILLPGIALFVGLGISFIFSQLDKEFSPVFAIPLVTAVIALSFLFSYHRVKDFYNYPNDLDKIATLVQALTKEDDKIVTDRLGDTTLLYLANRRGSPAVYKSPEEFKEMGYAYIVTANPNFITELKEKEYQIVIENDRFALVKL